MTAAAFAAALAANSGGEGGGVVGDDGGGGIGGDGGGGGGGATNLLPEAFLNSVRIGIVADKLAACDQLRDERSSFLLCLSLARGIDYGVANNDIPDQASRLPPVLKQVCHRKNRFLLHAAIMVLMISVKNACKMGWFSPEDTEELITLANEVGSDFGIVGNLNSEISSLPILSSIMSRFYPQLKLGHIIASLEVKPGYGTYAVDFHISKDISYSPEEKMRLLVASKDNLDTSSCIISPQQVNFLLNGKGVERRTNIFLDPGPQLPTIVNPLLKFGTNLLQAVGHFTGHYIILIAFMRAVPASALPVPQDYVRHDPPALSSESDLEIIEGPSRISLNCPISYQRIVTPVKGHLCKHYQCFDLKNYVEINSKRPSWRCPHCNQSICFSDIRVDQNMVKVLKVVGENVSEVMFSADGSWTVASSNNRKDESEDKNSDGQLGGQEPLDSSVSGQLPDASGTVCDLTKEDDEMDAVDRCEPADTKPVIHHNIQSQPVPTNSTRLPTSRCTDEFNQHSFMQAANGLSSGASLHDYGSASYNSRSESQNFGGFSRAPIRNFGISPVLTDAVSPALTRQFDSFQGNLTSSTALGQLSVSASLHLQEAQLRLSTMNPDFGNSHLIPRNVSRTPSAIQALPVQMPSPNMQQHSRPAVTVGTPAASGSSVSFQVTLQSSAPIAATLASSTERQWHRPVSVANMAAATLQNRPSSQVTGLSTASHDFNRMPQTLSQPPHLMRSSQLPRNHVPQRAPPAVVNTPSTVQRVQLTPQVQQAAQMRQAQTSPLQTQSIRMPLNSGVMPQAVSRTENLIDTQSEQNWRPTGRMRGSLTGQAYSAALSQLMGQSPQSAAPSPSTRPTLATPSSVSPAQVLLANRMNAQVSQPQNRHVTDAATVSGAAGAQSGGPRVVN